MASLLDNVQIIISAMKVTWPFGSIPWETCWGKRWCCIMSCSRDARGKGFRAWDGPGWLMMRTDACLQGLPSWKLSSSFVMVQSSPYVTCQGCSALCLPVGKSEATILSVCEAWSKVFYFDWQDATNTIFQDNCHHNFVHSKYSYSCNSEQALFCLLLCYVKNFM